MAKAKWTVVQHSGFGFGGKQGFKRGLEEAAVTTKAQEAKVKKVGGVLFDSYLDAADFCEAEMYPNGSGGMYPRAEGGFSDKKIDGLRIYIPKRKDG